MEHFWTVWQVTMVAVSATGQRLAGKKRQEAWPVLLIGSVMWTVFGMAVQEIGPLLNGMVFGGIYLWNWADWHTDINSRGGFLRALGGVWVTGLILTSCSGDARIVN